MNNVVRYIRLYGAFARLNLASNFRGGLQFLLNMLALTLNLGSSLLALIFFYGKFPALAGWSMDVAMLIFAVQSICGGVMDLAFGADYRSSGTILQGGLDMYLIRPAGILFQMANGRSGGIGNTNGLGPLVVGLVLLIMYGPAAGVLWSAGKVAFFIVLVLSGCVIRFAIGVAVNSVVFWTKEPGGMQEAVSELIPFTRYPINAFGKFLEFILTWVVPFAFYGFFPAVYLIGATRYSWIAILAPGFALVFFAGAYFLWRRGLRKYQSFGG